MKLEDFRATEEFDLEGSDFSVEEAADGKKKLRANVTIIKSGVSHNRRNYRESALKESVDKGIWNGVRMFANHSKTVPLKRPMSEMVAAIESTSWDAKEKAVKADVVFFNKEFYEFAERAKDYMGDSINAMVQGTRERDARGQVTEDIHRIVQPHSVDFVIYPSAGGMIHSFEGESEMEVDWTAITLKDIKESAPTVYEEIKAEVIATQPKIKDPEPDPPEKGMITEAKAQEMINAALTGREKEVKETQDKISAVSKRMVEAFSKSGLPELVQKRVMVAYEGAVEFDEIAVTESINSAKEELSALGVGPRIKDQGPSGAVGGSTSGTKSFSAQESVDAAFGMNKKASADDKKKDGE